MMTPSQIATRRAEWKRADQKCMHVVLEMACNEQGHGTGYVCNLCGAAVRSQAA
jgi:hypothetical protein